LAKHLIAGLNCIAVMVAMYRVQRTLVRPPKMARLPRMKPESRLRGATPTRAAIFWRLSLPSSGSSTIS